MNSTKVAKRYANALFQFTLEKQKEAEVHNDILLMREILEVEDFKRFLNSPIISSNKKQSVVKATLADKVSETTLQFVLMLFAHNREALLHHIVRQYDLIYKERNKILDVELITAVDFGADFKNNLIEKLKKETHYQTIHVKEVIDEKIIGGFILTYNDKKYDASIRRKINDLKQEIVLS